VDQDILPESESIGSVEQRSNVKAYDIIFNGHNSNKNVFCSF
jgi:hypothetical protein